MTHPEPQGLLAIWANVDEDYQREYAQWQNCEHMAERVTIPGFHVGHRYCAIEAAREFFMVYETDTPDVMQSQPYLHSQNHPTPWTRKSIAHFRNTRRTIYSLVASEGERPATDAPYVLLVHSNPAAGPGGADEVIRWHCQEHLPRVRGVEGVLRARLYRTDTAISNIQTAERQIHGASPGSQEFLAMYEMFSPDIPLSDIWRQAARGTERSAEMMAALRDVEHERYWLDFALWATGR